MAEYKPKKDDQHVGDSAKSGFPESSASAKTEGDKLQHAADEAAKGKAGGKK